MSALIRGGLMLLVHQRRGDKAKATVDFPKFGRKNLMLKFANLKVL